MIQMDRIKYFHIYSCFLIYFIIVGLNKNSFAILNGLDGVWLNILINSQLNESSTSSIILDPIRGPGNFSTVVNSGIIFGYKIQKLFGSEINAYVSSLIFSIELVISSLLCGNIFKFKLRVSFVAGLISCCLILPVIWPHKYYPIFGILPHLAELMLLSNCTLFLLNKLEGSTANKYKDYLWQILVALLIMIMVSSNPIFCTIFVPNLILTIFYIFAKSKYKWKFAIKLTCIFLILLGSGTIGYLMGLGIYSVPFYFANELFKNQQSIYNISILFHNDIGKYVFIAVIAHMIIGIFNNKNYYKSNSAFSLAVVGFILVLGATIVNLPSYNGPSMLYFEVGFYPYFFLCFTQLMTHLYEKITVFLNNRTAIIVNALIVVILIILVNKIEAKNHSNINYPPKNNKLINGVREAIALTKGTDLFKGRLATFTGILSNKAVIWSDLHGFDNTIAKVTNNDFRFVGPWYERIPTLQEYSQTISPATYFLFTRTLSRKNDKQIRNIIIFSKINTKILALYGVKYVITDKKIEGLSLADSLLLENKILFLYEIIDTNIGNYSPTNFKVAGNYVDFIEQSINEEINFRENVYVKQILDYKLIPIQSSAIMIGSNGRMNITALNSKGFSILVLPFEFSSCIKMQNNLNNYANLITVNFNQMGIIFEDKLDVNIEFRNGILDNSYCRIVDSIRFNEVNPKNLSLRFPVSLQYSDMNP